MNKKDKLANEVESFQNIWVNGFCRSNRLGGWEGSVHESKQAFSKGMYSDLEKISEICIQPYINRNTVALDIGTDGGVWLTQMVDAKCLIGMDCRDPFKTRFWENVVFWLLHQRRYDLSNVKYVVDTDFQCSGLSENSIDFVFSYDVFCHISYTGTVEYLKNLYSKLKKGANLFIMIADSGKYRNQSFRDKQVNHKNKPDGPYKDWNEVVADYDGNPYPGRLYFYGIERFCDAAKEFGYDVVEEDVIKEYDNNFPIVHLRKPSYMKEKR